MEEDPEGEGHVGGEVLEEVDVLPEMLLGEEFFELGCWGWVTVRRSSVSIFLSISTYYKSNTTLLSHAEC